MKLKPKKFTADLREAVDSFDRDAAAGLCDKLILHVRERDDVYPAKHAKTVLGLLRGKRYFDLMQKVADALIQNGQTDARVRRQYAQSQLDQGNLTAAISTLENLSNETAPKGAHPNAEEYAEARGLLGRAYKDLYILAGAPKHSRNRRFLEKAIECYRKIYQGDCSKVWQGINSVALIRRADADGVKLKKIADARSQADTMASRILAEVTQRCQDKKADTWDFATALEACIGLQRHEEAVAWLMRYLNSDFTDAFELGATYRQLTQVWNLHTGQAPGDKILPPLKAALLQQKGSEIEIGVQDAAQEKLDELTSDAGYEKILGTEGFRTLKWFQRCMLRASAIARVEDTLGNPVGTAFVVRGGDLKPELGDELLLLTNAHVIRDEDSQVSIALPAEKAVLKFELWKDGDSPEFKVRKLLWSSPPQWLDATLLRPTPAIEGVEPIPVTNILPLADGQQRAYIIGHPQGRKLSFSIHDNHLLDYDDRRLHYRSPTEPGSSGSPVLNDQWELIGLHHSGTQYMPRLHGKDGTYPANEGIWVQAIIRELQNIEIG